MIKVKNKFILEYIEKNEEGDEIELTKISYTYIFKCESIYEVMNNKFFRILVGSHSGLGYTSKHIVFALIIVRSRKIPSFPFNINKIIQIKSQIKDYNRIEYQNSVMFHTPDSRNIDGIILDDDDSLAVFQVKTGIVTQKEMDKFHLELQTISEITEKEVNGWFVSLLPLDIKIIIPRGLKII